MRLSMIEQGNRFKYEGIVYTHDLVGRSGNGMVAVRNVETGEQLSLKASVEVELVNDIPELEVPDVVCRGKDMVDLSEFKKHETPDQDQLLQIWLGFKENLGQEKIKQESFFDVPGVGYSPEEKNEEEEQWEDLEEEDN